MSYFVYRWFWLCDVWAHHLDANLAWRCGDYTSMQTTRLRDVLRFTLVVWTPEHWGLDDDTPLTDCNYELAWRRLRHVSNAEYNGHAFEAAVLYGWRWWVYEGDTLP